MKLSETILIVAVTVLIVALCITTADNIRLRREVAAMQEVLRNNHAPVPGAMNFFDN